MELAGPRMLVLEGGEQATITINLVMINQVEKRLSSPCQR